MSNSTVVRITKEIRHIQQGTDLSLAVAYQDANIQHIKALIVGPPETPYEFGFFEFNVRLGRDYPSNPPSVTATTTNGGRCRFNPNIYAGGKVCLSILGTWRGERPGEEWSSAQGLESILISIQSLMSSNPYENEPGYENKKAPDELRHQVLYADKIRHETLRIAVIQKLEEQLGILPNGQVEPPAPAWELDIDDDVEEALEKMGDTEKIKFEPFNDLFKRRFLWYYDTYLGTIETFAKKHREGEKFQKMEFEHGGNTMDGSYQYSDLKRRLNLIHDTIHKETQRWSEEGMNAKRREIGVSANLQRQFEQIVEAHKNKAFTIDLELVDDNPFLWQVTYFGKPMTHLDGGMFKIRISLSPRFPDEQPRVQVITPIYHHRVAKDGTLCYFPKKVEEMKSHIDAIVEALEDDSPPYDPRTTVHPEAAKLYWGSAEDKKKYHRQLRRSVERSIDEG